MLGHRHRATATVPPPPPPCHRLRVIAAVRPQPSRHSHRAIATVGPQPLLVHGRRATATAHRLPLGHGHRATDIAPQPPLCAQPPRTQPPCTVEHTGHDAHRPPHTRPPWYGQRAHGLFLIYPPFPATCTLPTSNLLDPAVGSGQTPGFHKPRAFLLSFSFQATILIRLQRTVA